MNRNDIGIGIITCNRELLFKQCLDSIPNIGQIIVINDGQLYNIQFPSKVNKVVHHKKNVGVGASKNEGLKYLLEAGCKHIFLIEDDVEVINPIVFEKYIKASELTGLMHFNFAYHGQGNMDINGKPYPKKIINYGNDVSISFHGHLSGAFSYYQADALLEVGLMDEFYRNAYEHLDHTLSFSDKGFYSPFGWFADIEDSFLLIRDLDTDLTQSVIRKNKILFLIRYRLYSYYFRFKRGNFVEQMPVVSEIELMQTLRSIQQRYTSNLSI